MVKVGLQNFSFDDHFHASFLSDSGSTLSFWINHIVVVVVVCFVFSSFFSILVIVSLV